jgi:septum formation protein
MAFMKLILASKSEYRKHALNILGLKYSIIPSNLDESTIRHFDPRYRSKLLATKKAQAVGNNHTNSIIIAADTFAVLNSRVLEKPKDLQDAKKMLKALSGKTHELISGIAVYNSKTKVMLSAVESSKVTFRKLTDFEINDYIKRYPVLKCAAAFESDGLLRFAEKVEGNYNFRAGLPVNRLIEFLRKNGVKV